MANRELRGFPFAVPIHLKASDSKGQVAEIQDHVLVDVSMSEMYRLMKR